MAASKGENVSMTAVARVPVWVLVAGALGCLWAGPVLAARATPPTSPEDMAERMIGALGRLPGWILTEAPTPWHQLEPEDQPRLQDSLRGYRLRWGVTGRFRPPADQAAVTVQVLCLAEPLEAYGAYVRHLGAATAPSDLAPASHWEGTTLWVWRSACLLLVTPDQATAAARTVALQAAQAVTEDLPAPATRPLLLRIMPQVNQILTSLTYYPEAVPELPCLRHALSAHHVGVPGNLNLTVAQLPGEAAAREAYQQLTVLLDTGGERRGLPNLGDHVELIRSREHGLCLVLQERQYVAAATEVGDRLLGEALLRIILTHIHVLRP